MYEQFYGLKNVPFRLSPDPSFFFGSEGHNRALAYLRYGLAQKEGFIVITGAPGTGKTTLARSLLAEVSREKIIIAELNTTHLDADDVLRMVAASFGLEHEGLPKATLLKRLESFCVSRYRAGYHVLLLVDEAQNLPLDSLEELRMLSNFYLGKDALIQIFLLGQEQFRTSLYTTEMEQLRQRVVASSHLEPLGNDETRKYIEHRLSLSGWTNNPQFSDRAFARIYALTKGVPRRINTFCERLMLYGALEELTEFHDDTVKTVAKELMGEVSAKGVKLSDINPGVPEVEAAVLESMPLGDEPNQLKESGDSDMLAAFSDDVADVSNTADETDAELTSISSAESLEKDSVFDDTTVIDEDIIKSDFSVPESQEAEQADTVQANKADTSAQKEKKRKERVQPLRVVSSGNAAKETFESLPQTETPVVDTKPVWWDLVALAAAFHREPDKFKSLNSSKTAIPSGVSDCFKIAIGKMRVPEYLRTGELSALTDQDIRDALRYYIKNVLLSNTADYYRRLGVTSGASFDLIRSHYKYLFRLFQPDKEQNASNWDETYTRRINQAYGTLRSTENRKEYDAFLSALKSRNKKSEAENKVDEIVASSGIASEIVVAEDTVITDKDAQAAVATEKHSSIGEKKAFPVKMSLLVGIIAIVAIAAVATIALFVMKPELMHQFQQSEPPIQSPASLVAPSEFEIKSSVEPVVIAKPKIEAQVAESAPLEPIIRGVTTQTIAVEEHFLQKKDVKLNTDAENVRIADTKVAKPIIPVKPVIAKPALLELKQNKQVIKPVREVKKQPIQNNDITIAKMEKTNKLTTESIKTAPANAAVALPASPVFVKPSGVGRIASEKSTQEIGISQKRLNNFITHFSLAYEEGDLEVFMAFFSDTASTNDAPDKMAIRADYKKLFSKTEMRVIDLDELSWKIKKHKAVGKGQFVVTVLGDGAGEMKKFTGLIKLEVVKINNKLKLNGMYHAYGVGE